MNAINSELAYGPINPKTQGLSIIASLVLLGTILVLVRKGLLKSGYSIIWLMVSGVILTFSVFTDVLFRFSELSGIYYPTSTIFALLIIGVILISINYSIIITKHEDRIKKLGREIALLKQKYKKVNKAKSKKS